MTRAIAGLAAVLLGGCASCPPSWLASVPRQEGYVVAAASCGEVFVDARAVDVALARAARIVADRLGVGVEGWLRVTLIGETLFVEAGGDAGPVTALDGLELVSEVECDGHVHVLVRLATVERAP